MRPKQLMVLILGLALGTAVLAAVLDAAGEDVALAVAIAAVAVLVASWVRVGVLVFRAAGSEEEEGKRVSRGAFRTHFPIMIGAPFVVIAAHPWGVVTFAVAFGAGILCQMVFLHTIVATGMIRHR